LAEDCECIARFSLVQEFPGASAALDVYPAVTFRDVEAVLMFMSAAFGMSISDE
jgi:hypothetical protein